MAGYPVDMSVKPGVTAFFDPKTGTITYVVQDPGSDACAIIDPVLDINYAAGRISTESADKVIGFIREKNLDLQWLIETHVHADHLSGARYIRGELGGEIGIGNQITVVQETFGEVFNEGPDFMRDGSQFDVLFADGDTYQIGTMTGFAMHTPGHTPACMTHVIGDAGFVGDTLFMPDSGSARADFPGGDAGELYDSLQKILSLPDDMRLFMCHDYGQGGKRDIAWETSVAEQRTSNIHVGGGKSRSEYVEMRETRDATLDVPALILPSLQVNMRAGEMPPEDEDGRLFFKLPINAL